MIKKMNSKTGLKAFALCAVIGLTALTFSGCSKENNEPSAKQTDAAVKMPSQEDIAKAKERYDRGVQLTIKGRHDEAIKEYDESVKLNPNSAEPYNNLGFEYFDKAIADKKKIDAPMLDKAIGYQQKALALNPNLANAHYGLAQSLEKKGDKPNAVNSWRAFMQLSEPHSKWWMQAKAHIDFLEGKKPVQKKKAGQPAGHK
ncbi:MAG: tetratricopeptide repeat protein [Deltaproteobacteria bacterium]|nr:tetratricopeptide repeat protein [Deltaproteobacteria bacterium]